jgi:hypothetical protein
LSHSTLYTQLKLWIARIWVWCKQLRYQPYTVGEVNELLDMNLPQAFFLEVPVGKGELVLLRAEASIPQSQTWLHIHLLCSLQVTYLSNPIYRAHVSVHCKLKPAYDSVHKTIYISDVLIGDIQLVQDEYALLKDTRTILDKLFPSAVTSLMGNRVKDALGMMTMGVSHLANDYLRLYLNDSKQNVLDYHKPQLQALLEDFARGEDAQYPLNPEEWEEQLFIEMGKSVSVEEGEVKFWFHPPAKKD